MVNGERIQFTAEEEKARDLEEQAWADVTDHPDQQEGPSTHPVRQGDLQVEERDGRRGRDDDGLNEGGRRRRGRLPPGGVAPPGAAGRRGDRRRHALRHPPGESEHSSGKDTETVIPLLDWHDQIPE